MVGQEPVLFNNTIEYNIKYNKSFTDQEMKEAATIANAIDFIMNDEKEVHSDPNSDPESQSLKTKLS